MIFVSSSCIKAKSIREAVDLLARSGFKNIELSGGTGYYKDFVEDLLNLKAQFNLNFRCHNYFPPPQKDFVLNLASLDNDTHSTSLAHIRTALKMSAQLGGKKFGFHAGFLIEIALNELGQAISKKSLYDRTAAEKRFHESLDQLYSESGIVKLYVENNVLSKRNFENFGGTNPLLLTSSREILAALERTKFHLLLDLAHLKVSSKTLDLDFNEELSVLLPLSDYLHISENNSLADENHSLSKEGSMYEAICRHRKDVIGKDATLEIYSGIDDLIHSYEILAEVIDERVN